MFIFLLIFLTFYGAYYYLSFQVIRLNDLDQIFSQTASKAQADLNEYSDLLLEDLGKCYVNVLLLICAATAFCFVWILLLKYNAKLIIWISIFALPIILSVGLYFSITTYLSLRGEMEDNELLPSEQTLAFDKALQTILTAELISYIRNETLWLVVSIVLFVILTALFIILHSLRKRVRLSIALIRQASKAINGVKSTLFFPILPRAVGVCVLIYGVLIGLLIISASHTTYHVEGGPHDGQPCHPKLFANRTHPLGAHRPPTGNISGAASLASPSPSSSPAPPPSTNVRFPFQRGAVVSAAAADRFLPAAAVPSQPAPLPMPLGLRVDHQSVAPNQTGTALGLQRAATIKPKCVARQLLSRQHVWKYHALNVFATLWLIHFISGITQATLAGAFASYYWAFNKPRDVPFFAVTASFFRVLRHHLGDVAFGSFLIATIRYIRLVIEYIDNRIRQKGPAGAAATSTARSAACFLRVFFWLIDRFLKYIDRNAYIMMSMYGEGYLKSAKRAVELLYKNSTRALVLDYVTYFVLLVSRLLITGIAGYVTAQETFTADLHYKWLPIVLVTLGTYFIAKGLFSVYSMAVDTLFMCFLIDSTNNDGSAERPYFMSKDLRRIIKRNTVIP